MIEMTKDRLTTEMVIPLLVVALYEHGEMKFNSRKFAIEGPSFLYNTVTLKIFLVQIS